jgi:hypothetical protein
VSSRRDLLTRAFAGVAAGLADQRADTEQLTLAFRYGLVLHDLERAAGTI